MRFLMDLRPTMNRPLVLEIVQFAPIQAHCQRIKRIVLAPSWAEAVRKAKEVDLVDGVEHRRQRLLDNLVLQTPDTQGAL